MFGGHRKGARFFVLGESTPTHWPSDHFFFGGFLFSRFGASLFPMHTVSHIHACLTTP
jgi:hypothetical protein